MRFEWDPEKDAASRRKHGIAFEEAAALFSSGTDYLEIPDLQHSFDEDRFIAIGEVRRGVLTVVFTERDEATVRIISARKATRAETALYYQYIEGLP